MIESVAGFISAADALDDADQHLARVGETAPERGAGEDDDAGDEDDRRPYASASLPPISISAAKLSA